MDQKDNLSIPPSPPYIFASVGPLFLVSGPVSELVLWGRRSSNNTGEEYSKCKNCDARM